MLTFTSSEALLPDKGAVHEPKLLLILFSGDRTLFDTVAPLLNIAGKDLQLALGLSEFVCQPTPNEATAKEKVVNLAALVTRTSSSIKL
ncbi:hypothetical protein RHSIM_Rhsim11G0192200 [Rhododendron simsii]|uniref:Uncharacterized protein n=1 Tax=Rhododendron simsii TaxID=118357 RepID=A0A834LA82_RHOSS|nr:hypothetical protein RHSIM_Rhsim11G0192200 [Rhododendron simsii]